MSHQGKAVKVIVRIRPESGTSKDVDGIPPRCLRLAPDADEAVQIWNWRNDNEMVSFK